MSAKRPLVFLCLILTGLIAQNGFALPFEIIDARTAALGGTGLVTDARNSIYHNPALLAATEEDLDAIAIAPVYAKSTTDPDDVEGQLDTLNAAIKSSDLAAQNKAMTKLTDKLYQTTKINSFAFIVPSETIGANAARTTYEYHSVKPVIGGSLAVSSLEHRAIEITEYSINAGKLVDLSDFGFGDVQLGLGVKMMLFDTYDYSVALSGASLGLIESKAQNGSAINFGFGIVKELGVWKIGLVGRNLVNESIEYGHSNTYFHIKPQYRAGLAYQSRRALFEFDIDLTDNEKVGFGKSTSFAAMGWEYRVVGKTYVRAGLRQNLVGDKNLSGSVGLGIGFWGVNLDLAILGNSDEKAVYANLAFDI